MIEFQNVTFCFDQKMIIESFSESIAAGEHIALMGESGAGKSTLMNSLMGLTHPSQGRILIDGMELCVGNIQQIRSRIAWVPQEIHLPYEHVCEAIEEPFKLKVNQGKRLDKDVMKTYFLQLGLDDHIYQARMHEISGGERQRLMLIAALLLDKRILLLDEPTSAIDPLTKSKLISFVQELPVTLFAVTHDPDFAKICDRTIHLSKLRH